MQEKAREKSLAFLFNVLTILRKYDIIISSKKERERGNIMSRFYYTHNARQSAINEIKRQIDVLGKLTSAEMSYLDYRAITQNLNMLKDALEYEDKQSESTMLNKAIIKTAKTKVR